MAAAASISLSALLQWLASGRLPDTAATVGAAIAIPLVARPGGVILRLGILAVLAGVLAASLGHPAPLRIACVAGGLVLGVSVGIASHGITVATPGIRRWGWLLWPHVALVFVISEMAYLGMLPTQQLTWPFADKVLHFLSFGACGFWLHLWLGGRRLRVGPSLSPPIAVVLPFALASLEEALQGLSSRRTSDWFDLACDLVGLLFFVWLADRMMTRRGATSGPRSLSPPR